MDKFTVVVGNIGTVYSGNNKTKALSEFSAYKKLSHEGRGRAGGEHVTLCDEQGEPILEYLGADGE